RLKVAARLSERPDVELLAALLPVAEVGLRLAPARRVGHGAVVLVAEPVLEAVSAAGVVGVPAHPADRHDGRDNDADPGPGGHVMLLSSLPRTLPGGGNGKRRHRLRRPWPSPSSFAGCLPLPARPAPRPRARPC